MISIIISNGFVGSTNYASINFNLLLVNNQHVYEVESIVKKKSNRLISLILNWIVAKAYSVIILVKLIHFIVVVIVDKHKYIYFSPN